MSGQLQGKCALVTGAGRGIGRAVALALAEEGANVVVCDMGGTTNGTGSDKHVADKVVEECRELGVKARAHHGDVSDFQAAKDMIRTCVDAFGRIDILCNIAGIIGRQKLSELSESQWDRTIAVHLKGTFNLTRHAVPFMLEQRFGRIINCTSQEYTGLGFADAGYAAAKGGIVSLTYKTAYEMGGHGITCNAFAPRARTRFFEEGLENLKSKVEAGHIPKERLDQTLKEMTDPSYLAAFIAYLASDAAAGISGRIFLIAATTLGIWNAPEVVGEISRDWERDGRWRFEDFKRLVPEIVEVFSNPKMSLKG